MFLDNLFDIMDFWKTNVVEILCLLRMILLFKIKNFIENLGCYGFKNKKLVFIV